MCMHTCFRPKWLGTLRAETNNLLRMSVYSFFQLALLWSIFCVNMHNHLMLVNCNSRLKKNLKFNSEEKNTQIIQIWYMFQICVRDLYQLCRQRSVPKYYWKKRGEGSYFLHRKLIYVLIELSSRFWGKAMSIIIFWKMLILPVLTLRTETLHWPSIFMCYFCHV